MTAQTVWLPTSSRVVSQQPSRKNPVMGFIEQTSSRSPSTLRGGLRRPPPLPLSSLSIADSACAEIWVSKRRPAILRGRAKCSAFLVGRKIFHSRPPSARPRNVPRHLGATSAHSGEVGSAQAANFGLLPLP